MASSRKRVVPDVREPGVSGARVKKARALRGMKQWDLSVACGLLPHVISKIENDRKDISARLLKRLCRGMKISSDYLLELSDDPEPRK